MNTIERKILIEALTGSHNYNLDTEGSDKDYKIFTAPTFSDLYDGHYYKRNIITDTVDKDVKDIRQLPELLWKANIAYLELLFSKELTLSKQHGNILWKIFDIKDEIVKMNLPQLFKSTGGMFNQRMKKLDKGSDGTQHLVDEHGYNTKEAMHTFRTLYTLVRFADNGFIRFDKCLRPNMGVILFMLAIKDGSYKRDEFESFINQYHDNHFAPLKDYFYEQKPNTDLMEYISGLVKELVEDEIHHQLYMNSHSNILN